MSCPSVLAEQVGHKNCGIAYCGGVIYCSIVYCSAAEVEEGAAAIWALLYGPTSHFLFTAINIENLIFDKNCLKLGGG